MERPFSHYNSFHKNQNRKGVYISNMKTSQKYYSQINVYYEVDHN